MNLKSDIKLVLEDGTEFNGYSFGHEKSVSGEVVFNTAMTGYPESLTDPSYKGQILVLTYPIIGNYGVPDNLSEHNLMKHFESDNLHIQGLVISDYSSKFSHWNAYMSLANQIRYQHFMELTPGSLPRNSGKKGQCLARLSLIITMSSSGIQTRKIWSLRSA
jgi:carbamoyl-phosphate synthase small subunit